MNRELINIKEEWEVVSNIRLYSLKVKDCQIGGVKGEHWSKFVNNQDV